MPWQPVVDGQVLPGLPIDQIAAGSGGEVDVMVGTNTDDWRLWLLVSGAIGQITDEILTGPVRGHGYQSLAAYGLDPATALAAYRDRYPQASPGDLLAAVQTDWWMRVPAIRLADARTRTPATGAPTCTSSPGPRPGLGAVHAARGAVRLRHARPDAPLFGPLLGDHPPQDLARLMHAAWIAFATTGDPGWPRYDLHRRATMRFDTTSGGRRRPTGLGAGALGGRPLTIAS